MSLVLATLLAVAPGAAAVPVFVAVPAVASVLPSCAWNRPGQNPFMGDVVAAVDRYTDIPAPVRERLKARMAARGYDEVVSIRRDAIVGQARYGAAITGMHFGTGQVCGTVNRTQWAANAQERGLVYCESGHCILVPTVCRNVSRITRQDAAAIGTATPSSVAGGGGGGMGGGGGGGGAGAGAGVGVGGGSGGASGSGLGPAGLGDGMAAAGADASAATSAGGPAPPSFSQAAAMPDVGSADAAGGSDRLGLGGGAAGGAGPANAGSWAAAAGGASLGGVALGRDRAAPPARQLSAVPPENRRPLTDSGAPASPLPGSVVGPLAGPAISLPGHSSAAVSPVPEPASALLLLAGLGWLARRAVRRRSQRCAAAAP
jgi:hypothetical protein